VFDLDLRSGELRKSGARLNLQHQPLQLLSVLLERPGELVTRDEVRKRLWPDDTFVDFEQGLNAAVKRLRDVLGDSADSPRFVETVPRRGYRFIAPTSGPRNRVSTADGGSPPRWRWNRAGFVAAVAAAGALGFAVKSLLPAATPVRPGDLTSAPVAAEGVQQVTTGPYLTTESTI
jgi:DNA-binding winged helix-turn-helix (wHTH) protein